MTSFDINPTAQPMATGADASNGTGTKYRFTVGGTWATGDKVTLDFTNTLTGYDTRVGAGFATDISPVFALTFNLKMNVLAGVNWYFSVSGQPTDFNDVVSNQNGFIEMDNLWATAENLAALAPFQGKLAVFSRRTAWIYSTDPVAGNYALQQTLPNTGTVSGASVQPIGDMDIYGLADNGVRSVRVRVATNNAYVEDVGTPIDAILQPILASLTDSQKATACSIVEPSANRYWLFVPDSTNANGVGLIYVFSNFPNSQVAAWSTYDPSYQAAIASPAMNYDIISHVTYTGLTVGKRYAWTPGANEVSLTNGTQVLKGVGSFVATETTALVVGNAPAAAFTGTLTVTTYFTPQKFVVFNGQVFVRDTSNNAYQFGGSTNLVYENCGSTGVTPYMDQGTPATKKFFEAMDAAFQGAWQLSFSSDYQTGAFKPIYTNTLSSFQYGRIGVKMTGTHYAIKFQENSNGYALFSSVLVHVQKGDEK